MVVLVFVRKLAGSMTVNGILVDTGCATGHSSISLEIAIPYLVRIPVTIKGDNNVIHILSADRRRKREKQPPKYSLERKKVSSRVSFLRGGRG